MQLFDKQRVDNLKKRYEGKKYSKPTIVSLATDPRLENERQRLEESFKIIPEEKRADIQGRFFGKSKKGNGLLSAYNELVIDRLLRVNRLDHDWEPKVDEGRPDFFVKASTNFYLEVASVFETGEVAKEHKKIRLLLDELNKIKHHFFLRIQCLHPRHIPDNINYENIKEFVKQWMDSIDPAKLSESGMMVVKKYDKDGLKLKLTLIPKKSLEKGPIIGGWTPSLVWVTAEHAIRAIKEKADKYNFNVPYVVALSLEDIFLDLEDIIHALFGKKYVGFDRDKIGFDIGQDNDGLFTQKHGIEREIKHKRVSAILVIRRKSLDVVLHNFIIIHNPYANNPLPHDIFSNYSQLIAVEQNDTNIIMKWTKPYDKYELLK
jgi:hypothetical protein